MRLAVISDIHANLQAMEAVIADIQEQNVDETIFLGDLIGFGPSPMEVIEFSFDSIDRFVLGHCEAAICGRLPMDYLDDAMKQSLEWTRSVLNKDILDFLNSFPPSLRLDEFFFAHAEVEKPERFATVSGQLQVIKNFTATDSKMVFLGHTHLPGLYVVGRSGKAHWLKPRGFQNNFRAQDGKRYIVNVGSVGDPEDREINASYCILNTKTQSVYMKEVPFDTDAYRKELKNKNLPEVNHFLKYC